MSIYGEYYNGRCALTILPVCTPWNVYINLTLFSCLGFGHTISVMAIHIKLLTLLYKPYKRISEKIISFHLLILALTSLEYMTITGFNKCS